MTIDYKSIGDRIKRYRIDKKLSQEDLAAKIGIGFKHISNIESGVRGISLEKVVDIANALDVSADDLLTDNLKHSSSPVSTEIQDIMLDCNQGNCQIFQLLRNRQAGRLVLNFMNIC